MPEPNDITRLRIEYADRKLRFKDSNLYSIFNPSNLFLLQSRQRAVINALRLLRLDCLNGKRVLEIGCGRGEVLRELFQLGSDPENLFGIDLLLDRIQEALSRQSRLPLVCGDCQSLPYQNCSFDILLQFTAFSSVLESSVKQAMASDMLRVLKPGGLIFWYDFWLNPTNKQTKGIRRPEIRSLFSNCSFHFQKITLAPPIARRLVSVSWIFCMVLEKMKIFNTHYLVVIRKPE